MNLFLPSGHLNMPEIIETPTDFIFITGGRGTGKTFGALEYVTITHPMTFIFMRRTQSQLDTIQQDAFSPFKPLNEKYKTTYGFEKISKYNSAIYSKEPNDNGKMVASGRPIGYTCALSTIGSTRGFGASDVDIAIYDEFIKDQTDKRMKGEANAFFNAVESISRNRELEGKKPLKVICLSNSNELGNALYLELGLVGVAEKMKRKGIVKYMDKERDFTMYNLNTTPIGEKKRETALYKLTKDTSFSKMALDNDFSFDFSSNISSQPIKEYRPIVNIGEITIYKHKSKAVYYISEHCQGSPVKYATAEIERERFQSKFAYLWLEYLDNNILFESQLCEVLFTTYFN